jgi:translation initiation factor IF-1
MKHKKFRKHIKDFDPLRSIDSDQLFGKILVNNGNNFTVKCSDGFTRIGRLCNTLKKGPRLTAGMFVVVTLRDFETVKNNCDIIAYGNPPHHIIVLFDDRNKKTEDIIFNDSDDDFKEFEDSEKTNNNVEESLDWLDI